MNTLLIGLTKFDLGKTSEALDHAMKRNPMRDFGKQKNDHDAILKIAESFKGYSTHSDLDHISATMLIDCPSSAFVDLASCSELRYSIHRINTETVLALVSGTLREWLDASIRMTTKERDTESRLLGDAIQIRFDEAGFARIWKDRTTFIKLDDKTYIIKPKD